jgi:3-hydroxybutyryl-CoA dehydrogenase
MSENNFRVVGVVGAGQMGIGIAQVFAQAGYSTLLSDSSSAVLEKALPGLRTQLQRLVEKQKMSAAELESLLGNIRTVSSFQELKSCDLVIEAIVENLGIKSALFRELDTILPAHALLGTNTSSISVTNIAAATKRADRVMGIHFMNPVPVMKLVELIRGMQTSDDTFASVSALMAKIGKVTVQGTDSPGFIVNRILVPMVNEAFFLLHEGVKPLDIDQAMKLGTNQPMGPLELADFVGLDTLLYILQVLHRELGEDKYRPCPLLVKYVEAGWFGRKTKRGVYIY